MTTDADIIRRSLARPPEFAALFDRHATPVGRYARRLVGGDAGDDVLSETFLVAFRRRADFDFSRDSALPWLFGIATRLAHRQRAAEAKRWRALQASARVAAETAVSDIDALVERTDASSRLAQLAPPHQAHERGGSGHARALRLGGSHDRADRRRPRHPGRHGVVAHQQDPARAAPGASHGGGGERWTS